MLWHCALGCHSLSMTSEDVSNAAVLLSTALLALATSLAGVGLWRRLGTPRRSVVRYFGAAACLLMLSAAAMIYAAWP